MIRLLVHRPHRSTVIMALFAFDMLFLPMFHVGPVPFKLAYLLMILGGVALVPGRPIRTLWLICAGIAVVCWVGALYLWASEATASFSLTARNTSIFLLVPVAFVFGWRVRPASFDFVLWLMPLYLMVNLVLTYFYVRMPWLVAFYGLEDRVTSGLFAIRSPGIHYNPNLSSLAANLLLVAAVAADRAGFILTRSRLIRAVAFASVIGTHAVLGSRGEMLAGLAVGGFWLYYRVGGVDLVRFGRFAAAGAAASLAIGVTVWLSLDYLAQRSSAIAFARTQFTSTLTLIPADFSDPNARTNSILLRPFFEGERALDRVGRSPLWGSGFDTASVYPFDNVHFHNDWALMLVAGGVVALGLFALLAAFSGSFAGVYLVPFLLTAPVNSFILAPSHLLFYFAFVGAVAGRQRAEARTDRLDAP